MNTLTAKDALGKATAVAKACRTGLISYDLAKKICNDYLIIVNDRAKEIAKEHGQSPVKVTFTGLLR